MGDRFETDYDEEVIRQHPDHYDVKNTPFVTVAVAKGGVKKTSTIINLAYSITRKDRHRCRVLIIDMDSQGNASKYFNRGFYVNNMNKIKNIKTKEKRIAFRRQHMHPKDVPYDNSVLKMVHGEAAIPLEIYKEDDRFGMSLVGWSENWTDEFEETKDCLKRFKQGILKTVAAYKPDIVFFDTPPVDSLSGRFALRLASHFFCTFNPDNDSIMGVRDTFKIIRKYRDEKNHLIKCCAIFPVAMEKNTNDSQITMQEAWDDYDLLVTQPIPYSVRYKDASRLSLPMGEFCKKRIKDAEQKAKHIADREVKEWQEIIDNIDTVADEFMNRLAIDTLSVQLTQEALKNLKAYDQYEKVAERNTGVEE